MNKPIETRVMGFADDSMPMIYAGVSHGPRADEDLKNRPYKTTIAVDADGDTGSKLLVTVKVYKKDQNGDDTDADTYLFGGEGGGDETVVATVGDLVDALNDLPGVVAFAGHAPHDAPLDVDDFIDSDEANMAELGIEAPVGFLYRDVSNYLIDSKRVAWMRMSAPEMRDRQQFKLLDIFGTATFTTAPSVELYEETEDDGKGDTYYEGTGVASSSGYIGDDLTNAVTVWGPLILEVKSADLTAVNMKVKVQNAER